MAYVPNSGSVVAFQSQPSSLLVGASIIGLTPVAVTNIPSISGTVNIGTIPSISGNIQGSIAAVIIGGSIAASFTPPANQSVSGTVGASIIGLTPVAVTNTPSISGTVNIGNNIIASISGTVGASIVGTVPVTQTTVPWVVSSIYGNVSGSVVAFQGAGWSGSVASQQVGTRSTSVIGTYPDSFVASTVTGIPFMFKANVSSSIMQAVSPSFPLPVVGSISGSIGIVGTPSISGTVNIGNAPSIYGNISGSVVAFQGTSPWLETFSNSSIIAINAGSVVAISQGSVITRWQDSSILAVPVGSVITVLQSSSIITKSSDSSVLVAQQGTWRTSVAGTYATGASSVVSALGFLELGVRNDTFASVFATDGQYTPFAVGPVGEVISANAPINAWASGTASCFTGVFQPFVGIGSVAARYTYITGLQIANASGNSVYLTFSGAGVGSTVGSIIGYSVAPANGGSNILFPNGLKTGIGAPFQASISGVASVFLSAQGFTSKT